MVCCPYTSRSDRTYGTKTGVYLLALRISQSLFFPCYLLLDIQAIRAFFMPVPRKLNRIMGLFDVRQKFHQFILEDTKNIEKPKSSFSFLFFSFLLHLFLFFGDTSAVL